MKKSIGVFDTTPAPLSAVPKDEFSPTVALKRPIPSAKSSFEQFKKQALENAERVGRQYYLRSIVIVSCLSLGTCS